MAADDPQLALLPPEEIIPRSVDLFQDPSMEPSSWVSPAFPPQGQGQWRTEN